MNVEQLRFRFSSNVSVVRSVEVESDYAVLVVGDSENAAYEWVITRDGEVVSHSDDAYGWWVPALRDGLAAYCG